MARPFKICPDCGAHLDASEPCDCKDAIEREPPKPRERLKLLAVCREVDKESGRVSVYPLDLEITSKILTGLKMRAQFNPELRYFTTTTARWDRYGEVMAGTFIRSLYLSPLEDVIDMVQFYERTTPQGGSYIVAKAGFLTAVVIMPYVISKKFADELEELSYQCRHFLNTRSAFTTPAAEDEEEPDENQTTTFDAEAAEDTE